ncbi:hypothetical protein PCANC_25606 [Puccinia coronata f. sp. avenae]|uniref:Uncharacterized protein n=1 Tax=Puccinia coronata f. sp. avenae TaxID=200324 RepID=A0A2N5S275_9BASI|nr:hypothetical protein PCANC_25606 [Puccinia coronata f. sp. avenae]
MSVQRTPPHHPANTTTSRSAEDFPTESPKNTAIPNNLTPLHQQDHRVDGRQLPPRANSTNSGHYGNSSFPWVWGTTTTASPSPYPFSCPRWSTRSTPANRKTHI